jgi:hypothetical protein
MTIDHAERLGVKGGYDAIKGHAYFRGFDWNGLAAGTLDAPITPSHKEINADLPDSLKPEFKEWARKPMPEDAPTTFASWAGITTHVVEQTAVKLLDKNPDTFDPENMPEDQKVVKEKMWFTTIKAPGGSKPASGGASQANDTEVKEAGGGCCLIL